MSKDSAWLRDMVIYAQKALELAEGFELQTFFADTRTHLAVTHTLAIAGEAASQVQQSTRAQLASVPWFKVC